MAVTAKQLSKSGARGKDLDGVVREQLHIVDDKLVHAPRTWGWNALSHDMPTTFQLPGLEKKDAQRIVYSAIIRSLEKRGFDVKLELTTERSTLLVGWMTDLDQEEVEAMNALIKAKRVDREGAARFLAQGGELAAGLRSAQPAPLSVKGGGRELLPRGGVVETRAAAGPNSAEAAILAAAGGTPAG